MKDLKQNQGFVPVDFEVKYNNKYILYAHIALIFI